MPSPKVTMVSVYWLCHEIVHLPASDAHQKDATLRHYYNVRMRISFDLDSLKSCGIVKDIFFHLDSL